MFEELDYAVTDLGALVLRRRRSPSYGDAWIYEVTIHGEFLMSSAVKDSELALATLPLQRLTELSKSGGQDLDVLVGGLGLGYTALAALGFPQVKTVLVVELLEPVLQWHREGLVPAAVELLGDPRTTLLHADFFEVMRGDADEPRNLDAILLDIDHSPEALLHARHASFYETPALQRLADRLTAHGIFALWSADEPSASFLDALRAVFPRVDCEKIRFDVPHLHEEDENYIIMARR